MRNLIDLCEIKDVMEAIEDRAFMETEHRDDQDRESHIVKLIKYAFDKIGLVINHNNYSISYEHDTRQAEVRLESPIDGIPLTQLVKLRESGLSEEYNIVSSDGDLWINFSVMPEMDNAQII